MSLLVQRASHPACEEVLELEAPRLLIGAFTARDPKARERHLAELERAGVTHPGAVPFYFPLPSWLIHVEPVSVEVASPKTSGEVEAVLIKTKAGVFIGAGSDHTDRELERSSIPLSKHVCPKILARGVWPWEDVRDHWELLELQSAIDGSVVYQEGTLGEFAPPLEMLEDAISKAALGRDYIVFLGTLPLKVDEFAFGGVFSGRLRDPVALRELSFRYTTTAVYRLEN